MCKKIRKKRGHKPPFFDILIIEIKFKIKNPLRGQKERTGSRYTYKLDTYIISETC